MLIMTKGKIMGYELTTWANGFGIWHCRADFAPPGVGNSPEGEAVKYRALAACKRKIRQEVAEREAPRTVRRLSYHVVANNLDSLNRMWSITVAEKTLTE
jgi:hypothetical protein